MKKTLIALSIFAFVGSIAIASSSVFTADGAKVEQAEGGKKKKSKSCKDDCTKDCCAKGEKTEAATKASCTSSSAGKSFCSKGMVKETKSTEENN